YANFKNEYYTIRNKQINPLNYFKSLGGHKFKGLNNTYIYGVRKTLLLSEVDSLFKNKLNL
ncbi:MAG: hypothetical protein Q8O74_07230, partial [bacterium]|nr:hypothetical protein [bacterium]